MVRTFVAIDLPEEIRESIRASQDILRQAEGRLAIVDPVNLHITVKFLGEIDPAQVEAIGGALRAVKAAPFDLTIGRAVCNPPRRARVIWCDVTDTGESAALARQVDDLLSPLGFSREMRPFCPHVTLARVKEFHPSQCRVVERIPSESFGRFRVEGIKLKKSTLSPRGPTYEDLLEVPL